MFFLFLHQPADPPASPALLQEWQDEFHKGLRIADLQWNIFTSLATLIILLRFRSLGWAIQVRTVLAGTVDSGMLVLQLYNYPLFSRHREKLITVARLIRIGRRTLGPGMPGGLY